MIEAMGLKCCIEVPLNGITSVPNFMKIYQPAQKLLVVKTQTDGHTDRQARDLISLPSFLESRLKKFLNDKTGKAYCLLRTGHSYCVLLTYCPDRQECPANLLIRGSHQQSVPYFSFRS
jgi:hypothetical protein